MNTPGKIFLRDELRRCDALDAKPLLSEFRPDFFVRWADERASEQPLPERLGKFNHG